MCNGKKSRECKEFTEQNLLQKEHAFSIIRPAVYRNCNEIMIFFYLCFREKMNTSNPWKCPTLIPLHFGILCSIPCSLSCFSCLPARLFARWSTSMGLHIPTKWKFLKRNSVFRELLLSESAEQGDDRFWPLWLQSVRRSIGLPLSSWIIDFISVLKSHVIMFSHWDGYQTQSWD